MTSGLAWLFPCRVKGEVIAVLGVGRKDGLDPLNSEEVDTLKTLAAQAATAIMNGQLYQSLAEKADELRGLKDYNENILESLDSGIVVLDLEGRVVRWNRAMEGLYGRARAEVLGQALDSVFPEAFLEALRGSLVLGDHDEIAHVYKLHLPAADGRSQMVNLSVAPFQAAPGERCGTILILDDITARVRLEEQLQHTEKMASVGLLAAGVAHEVNTPLAGISSYTQLLRGQLDEQDPRQQVLEKIEKQSFRAAKIINGLLNFSRSSGTEFDRVDVNKVLADVLALVEHQLDGSRIRVRRELAAHLPAGPRQREPHPAGVLQPDPERARRDAERRLAHAAHPRRRRDRGGRGGRHRPRHPPRAPPPHLRPVLHDQGHRQGDRARALRVLRNRPGARRRHLRRERPGPRHDLPGRAAGAGAPGGRPAGVR